MTELDLAPRPFERTSVEDWTARDEKLNNWPVVYILDGEKSVYVGESLSFSTRMHQHLANPAKRDLKQVRVVVDDTFNKSACLDLESFLISLFAGDGRYEVLNRNDGIVDAEYFDRGAYQRRFREVFDQLRRSDDSLFDHSIDEIQNSDLFKLSPFKALNDEQMVVVTDILEGLFTDLAEAEGHELKVLDTDRARQTGAGSIVIQGDPGTGKTIVAIYLMKLLSDIRDLNVRAERMVDIDVDSPFAHLFTEEIASLLEGFRIGFVIPQQSLRDSIKAIFKKTPGLSARDVLNPFDVGGALPTYDLLIVDETHRLSRRAAQAMGTLTKKFGEINQRLFGADDLELTQVDWITKKSKHQIFLVDPQQTVRPADLSHETVSGLIERAAARGRKYDLTNQMRVRGGASYIKDIRRVLAGELPEHHSFEDYDFRVFDSLKAMHSEILSREKEVGLSRIVAGYAWEWKSRKHRDDPTVWDIEFDGVRMKWNTTTTDWINSPKSLDEAGSIHTVQGYDLNYAGVIIGRDLRYDEDAGQMVFDRSSYFDRRGKANNGILGIRFSDDDLLELIRNIYSVLMTRGMQGTYVYAVDEPLRRHLHDLFG